METNKKDQKQKKTGNQPEHKSPEGKHISEGHSTQEASERSATTDSSRSPKNPHDDGPTGGNVR